MEPLTKHQSGVYLVALFATWVASIANTVIETSRRRVGQAIHGGSVILVVISVVGAISLLILVWQVGRSDAGPSKRLAAGRRPYQSRWGTALGAGRRYPIAAAWIDLFMRMYFGVFVRSAIRTVLS